ncbi:hypothetical protein QJQ45_017104 [Haematococcus lacustris]|nr:hypothetical protein QJQ45_017104 [Haematococcus lacustris]
MDHCGMIITPGKPQLLVIATACLIAYRVMGKEKRKGANRQNKGLAKKLKGWDCDSDSKSDCDFEPESQSDSEPEPEREPVTQPTPRRCSTRLAALAPAAPTGPPLPLEGEDPVMLRQPKQFCQQHRHPMLIPVFGNPSNQALLAKLQELGNMGLRGDSNTIGAHSMQLARWELQATDLVKTHVADLIKEADKHRHLMGMKKQGSLRDTLSLPCRMRHAVHVCRCLEQWQQPPTPVLGQPKRGLRLGVGPRTRTCPPPYTLTPMARVGLNFIKLDSRVLHGVCKQLGLTKETKATFTLEPALSHHWARGIVETREYVFDPDTQIGVGIDPGETQAVSAASGVWDPQSGQLMADQLRRWKLTKGQVKHASGLNNARRDTERWLAPIKPHLQHLAAASSAGTSLEANVKHITVTPATWDAVWEVYLDPKWARQRLRLYGAQDRALGQFFKKLEKDMAKVSMERHGRAKQLVVFFGAASIGTGGGWGADAVLRACCMVVCRPRGRVVLVEEHRTTRVSSAVNGQQSCEEQPTRRAGWKPPKWQVDLRLLRPAWSQQRDQPVRGLMWCPVVAPRKPPQAPCSSQEATQPAASEPGPSTPPPAKRSKRTEAEPPAEPTKGTGKAKGKAAKPNQHHSQAGGWTGTAMQH